jgi:hypothetical protein
MEIVTVSCLSALCVSLCSVNPDGKIEAVVLVNFVAAAGEVELVVVGK